MTEKLLIVVGITTLCMLTPGPDMVLVMRNTLTANRRAGRLTAAGVLTGNVIHISYCAVGIALLVSRSPVAFRVLRIASAAYLVYLGVQSLRTRHALALDTGSDAAGGGSRHPYWQGLLNNVLNPKGVLFYLGVFTQLITPEVSLASAALLVAVMLAVSTAFWAVFVQALQMAAIRVHVQRWAAPVERTFGLVLIAFGSLVAMFD